MTLSAPSAPSPRAALDALLVDIAARRGDFERRKSLSPDIVARLKGVGVYRAMVSRQLGGDGRSPAEFCEMIEAIATADGSAGWVASFGATATYLAGLPIETLEQIYADGPDVVFAGGLFPVQPAIRVQGGLQVSGRWKFASGCPGASLIGVGVSIAGDKHTGLPRMAVMPAGLVTIEENWDVIGLQGTGSHDLVVKDVVVPENWTFIRGGPPALDEPLYRYPAMGLAAQVLAVVGLGVARAAIDDLVAMANKVSITGAPRLGDRALVQIEIARAEMMLRAARAGFYDTTQAIWAAVLAGHQPQAQQVVRLRMASTHAARTAVDVTQAMFRLAGTTGIYVDHPLSRYVRDAMVVAQHAFLSESTLEGAGRILLGMEAQPGYP